MNLDDEIDKLLSTTTNPTNEPKLNKIGAEWQAGVIWNGNEGTITTTALPLEEAPNWDAILRIWGLDPDNFRVIEPVLFNVWGNPDGALNRQWKGKVVQVKDSDKKEEFTELENEIKKYKPKLKSNFTGTGAFIVVLSDWQIGKADGDGLKGTIERILNGIDKVEIRIKELEKLI
jgi:hypothetical protein